MPTVTTLDDRIRRQAARDLTNKIDDALTPICRLTSGHVIWTEMQATGYTQLSVSQALEHIKKAIFDFQRTAAENKAVSEFIAKVDGLQSQLDELRGETVDQ